MTVLAGALTAPAFAQLQSGGVDKPGTWYAGEGLKQGDYFSYNLCHVDYKECIEFGMDLWIKGDIQVGSETKWLAEVVVYDGNKVVVGEMEMGKVAPEPTGGSPELGVYRSAFKSSVAWLSAFATSEPGSGKGPKEFSATSWGKIGNIGGEQVLPKAIETVKTKSGLWETVKIGWRTGGYDSNIWIVDDFPFPVKAHTLTHVSEGIPPPEYKFELLEYEEGVATSPFVGIESTGNQLLAKGCDTDFDRDVAIKKPTKNFDYQIHLFYGPEEPIQGCEMHWLIKFISKYDDTEFLNQVQFDIFVVDDNLKPLRSMAQDDGRDYLYSPSGQYIHEMIVEEPPGAANYVLWVYGLAPEGIVPPTADDYLQIPITVRPAKDADTVQAPAVETPPKATLEIPSWIRQNAAWWADGSIDDGSFVQGLQFLIKEGIMQIPETEQGTGSSAEIPSWVRQNAAWWADGSIDDGSFVQGLQFLIKEGIMTIS